MQMRLISILLFINILAILLLIVISILPYEALRLIMGMPFLVFFPGYALIAACFPHKGAISSAERMAFAFGFSFAIVSFVGIILNYTSWSIRLYPILVSITVFIVTSSIIAWLRQRKLHAVEKPSFSFNLRPALWKGSFL